MVGLSRWPRPAAPPWCGTRRRTCGRRCRCRTPADERGLMPLTKVLAEMNVCVLGSGNAIPPEHLSIPVPLVEAWRLKCERCDEQMSAPSAHRFRLEITEQAAAHTGTPVVWVHPDHPHSPCVAPSPPADPTHEFARVIADLHRQFAGWGDCGCRSLVELVEAIRELLVQVGVRFCDLRDKAAGIVGVHPPIVAHRRDGSLAGICCTVNVRSCRDPCAGALCVRLR